MTVLNYVIKVYETFPFNRTFYAWSLGVPVVFFILAMGFRAKNWWPEKARKGSRRSDIMAFQITAFGCLAYMSMIGMASWFGLCAHWDMGPLIDDRFHGRAEFIETHLLIPMLSYQLWQIIACFVFADMFNVAMIGHHVVTFGLAYVCLRPYLQYYVCFYFGLAEITNIPLTIIDTFKFFPELAEQLPAVKTFCKQIFAALFFALRIVYWTQITVMMVPSIYVKLFDPTTESPPIVGFFLFAAAFLTGLQWLWGYKIYQLVVNDEENNRRHKAKRDLQKQQEKEEKEGKSQQLSNESSKTK